MSTRHPAAAADALLLEEPDAPIDAWTLDELDQSGELDSLRSAWAGADDAGN